MNVVAVAAQKGGVGKSTLAQCLAIEGLKEGRRTAIIDMDPQQSVAKWGVRRAAKGHPRPGRRRRRRKVCESNRRRANRTGRRAHHY